MNDDDDSAIVGWIIWALVTMFIFVVFMDWYGYMMDTYGHWNNIK